MDLAGVLPIADADPATALDVVSRKFTALGQHFSPLWTIARSMLKSPAYITDSTVIPTERSTR